MKALLKTYPEPVRTRREKGGRVPFTCAKMKACFLSARTSESVKDIAKEVGVSHGVRCNWSIEQQFDHVREICTNQFFHRVVDHLRGNIKTQDPTKP
jgi:ASC-1-like (ASCH) protein